MSYIHFSTEQLTDSAISMGKEILLVNNKGAYCSTTLSGCHTRKYHGLLITPQPQIDDSRYILLSSLDETINRGEQKMLLGTHRYPNVYHPEGYKLLQEFDYELTPQWTISAEDIELTKEILLEQYEDRVLIRYTVNKAGAPFEMRFDPFLAFRNIHSLSRANLYASKKWEKAGNGISCKLYNEFSNLFMQFSRKADFVATPDWYYNIEYSREQERGYDYSEDLYSPGYFKIKLKKGDQIIFSAGTSEISPRKLNHLFERELNNRKPLTDFNACLENAAEQFIISSSPQKGSGDSDELEIMAGYHWFGPWGRDTFISLPGLTLATGEPELCKKILDANLKNLKFGLFPNVGSGEKAAYNSADASLWFIWALQQYIYNTGTLELAWEEYGGTLHSILEYYRNGTLYDIHMEDNGLLFAGEEGIAVTWMDAVVDGKPVTPRTGFAVELNALWYNAIRFTLECARKAISHQPSAKSFINEWNSLSEQTELSFCETFWRDEKGYLADCVNGSHHDWSLRPNQIFAASLPFSPITDEMKKSLITIVRDKLLTPRGLRTLSPEDGNYRGLYTGNTYMRDTSYHQGTVWTWLLGHFAEAYLKSDIENSYTFIADFYHSFEPAIMEYGIATIAEIYDGDAPHSAKGAIAQAWSVAELLRIREILKDSPIKEKVQKKQKKQQPFNKEKKEKMRVLMFGWEFPPHISGGLGTACYGITSSLFKNDVDVLFVIPRLFGDEDKSKFRFINASDIKFETGTSFYAEQLQRIKYIQVDSALIPYYSPEEIITQKEEVKKSTFKWSEQSFAHFDFTGYYGKDLMKEVAQYAIVASTIARENLFDVIHAHDWLTFPAGIMAKNVSGKPLIIHVHATEFDRSGENINQAVYDIERKGMHEADAIITVSGLTKQILIDRYGVPAEKITIVHNGVLASENSVKKHTLRKKTKVVTFLGRVTFQKGPDYFVEAAAKVLKKIPDVKFVMAGSGDMLTRMIKRVAQLRIGSRFHFTGFLNGNEIERMFDMSDVYVMPSVSEPFGISPLEAVRSGVPVIISKQSGVSEVLNNAVKVDFWDTDALANAICGLLQYRALSTRFSKEAGKELEKITWDRAAVKVKALYQSFLHIPKKLAV